MFVVVVADQSVLESQYLFGFEVAEPRIKALLLCFHVFLEIMPDHLLPSSLLAVLVVKPTVKHLACDLAAISRRHKLATIFAIRVGERPIDVLR